MIAFELPVAIVSGWLSTRRADTSGANDQADAMELIELLESKGWSLDRFDPEWVEVTDRVVDAEVTPGNPAEDKVTDLMAALEASVAEAKAARDRKRAADAGGEAGE